MADSYSTLAESLAELHDNRSEAFAEGLPLIGPWVWLGAGTEIDEIFGEGGPLSRDGIYGELAEMAGSRHTFAEWLPPKAKLSFLSSFERDARAMAGTRKGGYATATVAEAARAADRRAALENLESIGDAPA